MLLLYAWDVGGVIELRVLQHLVDALLLLLSHETHQGYPFLPQVLLRLSREIVGELSKVDEYAKADDAHEAGAALLAEGVLPPVVGEREEDVEVEADHDLYEDGDQVLGLVVDRLAPQHKGLGDHREEPEGQDLHLVVVLEEQQDQVGQLPPTQDEEVPVAAEEAGDPQTVGEATEALLEVV